MVYTDGITEARDQMGELYGDGRLATVLAAHSRSVSALLDGLLEDVMRFQSGQPRDDIALVTVAVPDDPSDQSPVT